jgi:alanine-synthesizing transaminase
MKLAWVLAGGPDSLVATAMERMEIVADTYLSPSIPVQLAAPKFLWLREEIGGQLRERIAANLALLDGALAPLRAVRRLEREGGWYAVLRVPATGTDEALAVALLERCSVLAYPGHFFNFAQEGYLVVSLITPLAEFEEGVRRLLHFFGE